MKHFKYTLRGKRRIHSTPSRYEVVACHPWLAAELEEIQPEIVVRNRPGLVERPQEAGFALR